MKPPRARRRPSPPPPRLRRRVRALLRALQPALAGPVPERRPPFPTLVAVVLSAQSTDAQADRAAERLLGRFPTAGALARAAPGQVLPLVRTVGLGPSKARHLVAAARAIVTEHRGRIPGEREALERLPGIGHKSAGIILASCFGVPALPVDTHVGRVARRLGLSAARDPDTIEAALEALLPPERWWSSHHLLIRLGRTFCHAARPACGACPVRRRCPAAAPPDAAGRAARRRRP